MDLLSQYKQDYPEAFQEKKPVSLTDEYGRTYSGMVAVVMRLSGGRINDARRASYVLLAVTGVILLATVLVFSGVFGFSSNSRPQYSTDPDHLPPALRQQEQN